MISMSNNRDDVMPTVKQNSVDDLLCRWAEQRYALASVVKVDFEFADDGDYSDLTPGEGPYMRVMITYLGKGGEGPQQHRREDAVYNTALIREVMEFARDA
jgi:hypothetical protein